ncbi:aldehyde dehydrogenase family protein [Alteribacter lacisalsi]|uniref:Aldehyde dehydrogenase n=1 Tax=Alteribacter lacisalsi TaxID=2045244 RepID=A0A2W0HIR3_9BACI|nr:aldehyde dehydrogenase [Alteribacter lacisalsi]PYZ96872.1 aldehyde dehydrogenase family protein [Alteribacter lacisalsi]
MDSQYQALVSRQRRFFYSGETKKIAYRVEQLTRLKDAIKEREDQIMDAAYRDLGKSKREAFLTEIGFLYSEIKDMIKNIDVWAKAKKEKTPLTHVGSTSYIYKEPYGVTLIIGPWNYPFHLVMAPLIGAMAAGNTAILKPSEMTPHMSAVVRELVESTFEEEYVAVREGDASVAKELLDQNFDYIFFTGSVEVGKKVMEAASKHLTPVTLELGGKSPAIVMTDADVKLAAKRIVWGKFVNAGQTCVAPDYILVQEKAKRKLYKYLVKYIKKFQGIAAEENKDYPRIVNEKHHDRITALMDPDKIVYGGAHNREDRFIEPTIMDKVTFDDPVMGEEIFGPVLPMISFEHDYEVIDYVRNRPNPLALYLFTSKKETESLIFENLSFGGGCLNDVLMHITTPHLPFGGVGESGMGAYHGKSSFETFSHSKSVLKQTNKFDIPLRYSQSEGSIKAMRKIWE